MLPYILLFIGFLMIIGITVLLVMLIMYRRRGSTSPVHIEPYMKQPIITPPDSRNNSMLDVTHGDHTYFVEYTLKQVADYALNNQPDIVQSPHGKSFVFSAFALLKKLIFTDPFEYFIIFRPRERKVETRISVILTSTT